MNKRIRELAEQAGIVFWEMSGDVDWRQANREHLEEFALLIIRECIREIGYKSVDLLDIDFYPHYQERLKKHFGVEE